MEGPPGSGDRLRSLIALAEEEAERTCEFCDALGRVRTRDDWPGGWRKSVCDTCHSDWSARRIMIVCGVVWCAAAGEATQPAASGQAV